MYRTLTVARKSRLTHPASENRTQELAKMLINAFGYEQAEEQARQSHWDKVAQTIKFMQSKGFSRF